jgi:hydroxymethylglutaryl-CoA reductase (NADPH)
MRGSSLLPKQLRGSDDPASPAQPGWVNRQVTPFIQSLSRRACAHPIHTIVFIALLASTSYVGLLEGSLFEGKNDSRNISRSLDVTSLLNGARNLYLGEETGWKWQAEENIESRVPPEVLR